MPILRTLNQDFFKKWTPEMAYVLGYFAADGSMIRNNRGAHFIEFTSTDECLLQQLQKMVDSNHALTERMRHGSEKWKKQYRLQVGSRRWFEDLLKLGFTQNKSSTLRLPRVPKRYLGDFVRGYFDGDGCVYLGKHYSAWHKKEIWSFSTRFTSGSKAFLEEMQLVLRKCGIKGGYISTKTGGFELAFSRRDSLALYRLMYHTAQAPDFHLPRKRQKLEKGIQVLKLDRAGVAQFG